MITFNDILTVELLRAVREPRKVDEISLPSSPAPLVMGRPNPHYSEAIKRELQELSSRGLCELEIETALNLTGSRQVRRTSGTWRITEAALRQLKIVAEQEEREARERAGIR